VRTGISDLDSGWRAIVHGKWLILGAAAGVAIVAAAMEAAFATSAELRLPAALFLIVAMLGCAVIYLRSARRSDRLNSTRLASQLSDVPMLGRIPALAERRMAASAGGIVQEPHYCRAMRAVAAGFAQDTSRSNAVILVTSISAGEGTTSVALNLAAALARDERVMLVDADLREASLSRLLALPRYDAGLCELIERSAPFRSCLALTGIPNLHVIRTGSLPRNAPELLTSTRFERTMQLSTRYYTRIVIDSPPLDAFPDAGILAAFADAVVLVADARAGQFTKIRAEIDKLKRVNARCAGIVFNRVNTSGSSQI
jgi:capsular exopolysaccharide synthesis family protein